MNFIEDKIEPLTISIKTTSDATGESPWSVKNHLRNGVYRAVKSGRRTLVVYASVKERMANLPAAKFAPPRQRSRRKVAG